MHNLQGKILVDNQILLILLSVLVNRHIEHLSPRQAAFHTKCILSELESMLNTCRFNNSFITFYCYCGIPRCNANCLAPWNSTAFVRIPCCGMKFCGHGKSWALLVTVLLPGAASDTAALLSSCCQSLSVIICWV